MESGVWGMMEYFGMKKRISLLFMGMFGELDVMLVYSLISQVDIFRSLRMAFGERTRTHDNGLVMGGRINA
jgi:hypothetical protein